MYTYTKDTHCKEFRKSKGETESMSTVTNKFPTIMKNYSFKISNVFPSLCVKFFVGQIPKGKTGALVILMYQ